MLLRSNVFMLETKILNPHVLSLLARVRHTNALVIADRGFPFWSQIETVDISLTDDVPTILQVLGAIRYHFHVAQAFMANEFLQHNTPETRALFSQALKGIPTQHEPHVELKKRVPSAIGLIRTGDTVQYSNMVLVSG
jgi:D-ribose pyranase